MGKKKQNKTKKLKNLHELNRSKISQENPETSRLLTLPSTGQTEEEEFKCLFRFSTGSQKH